MWCLNKERMRADWWRMMFFASVAAAVVMACVFAAIGGAS